MAKQGTKGADIDRTEELQNNLGGLLHRAALLFRSEVSKQFATTSPGRLTENQLAILLNMDLDGIRISELAARSGLGKQTVGARVRIMAEHGILDVRSDPSDGRAKLVFPSERGAKLLLESIEISRKVTVRYTRIIGQRRMTQLHSALKILLDHTDTRHQAGPQ